jgi:hypothetical protein
MHDMLICMASFCWLGLRLRVGDRRSRLRRRSKAGGGRRAEGMRSRIGR